MKTLTRMMRSAMAALLAGVVTFGTGTALAAPEPDGIDITGVTSLDFGSVIATTTGGTVTVAPNGNTTFSGVFGFGGASSSPAVFSVKRIGKGNPHYTIILPASTTLTGNNGGTMVVDGFLSNPAGTGHLQPPAGVETLEVGATLRVGQNQAPGSYNGTFLVTVNLVN